MIACYQFEQDQACQFDPHHIISNKNKNPRRGQVATPVGRFGQVDKTTKFSHIKGRICFLALHKVCLDLQKIKEENKWLLKLNS